MPRPKVEPQIHIDDEWLENDTLATALVDWHETLDASKRNRQAKASIKKMLPLDGQAHRYRIEGFVIVVTPQEGGQKVEFERGPGHHIKIDVASLRAGVEGRR